MMEIIIVAIALPLVLLLAWLVDQKKNIYKNMDWYDDEEF
jgi:hypothetical protein